MNKFIKYFSISILLLSFISCDDDPTSLGINLLPEQDLINSTNINSLDLDFEQYSKSYDTDTLSLSNTSKIFLGKNNNVESTMLMKFFMFFPDSIKNAINGDSLVLNSAKIEMEPFYTYGDENNFFDFSLHEITNDWNSLDFDKQSLEELTYNTEDVSSNRVIGDSLITFDVDKSLVSNWLKLSAQVLQEENYGVYFNFNSASNKVIGFPSISPSYDSVLTRLKLIVEVPGNYIDTFTVQVTSDVHVVKGTYESSPTQSICVQGGIPVRSNLFIDVSKVPEYSIINEAIIKLSVNENESKIGSISSKYISVLLIDDYESSEFSGNYPPVLLELDSLSSSYSGEITHYVQEWLENGNNGIKLFLTDEVESLNKTAIYGTENPDLALRPYLEIIYTSKN